MKIKILLLKDMAWVWGKWEIKEVSDSYARNVIIRQGIWKIADKRAIKDFERRQKEKEEEEREQESLQSEALSKIQENWLKIQVSSALDWNLYEKIDTKDICNEIFKQFKAKFSEKDIVFPDKRVQKTWIYDFDLVKNGKKISLKLNILTK